MITVLRSWQPTARLGQLNLALLSRFQAAGCIHQAAPAPTLVMCVVIKPSADHASHLSAWSVSPPAGPGQRQQPAGVPPRLAVPDAGLLQAMRTKQRPGNNKDC
jgi:hypothetical protein